MDGEFRRVGHSGFDGRRRGRAFQRSLNPGFQFRINRFGIDLNFGLGVTFFSEGLKILLHRVRIALQQHSQESIRLSPERRRFVIVVGRTLHNGHKVRRSEHLIFANSLGIRGTARFSQVFAGGFGKPERPPVNISLEQYMAERMRGVIDNVFRGFTFGDDEDAVGPA